MDIRRLTVEDAASFWRLRLEALRRYPLAFGSAYEEAKDTPFADVRARFKEDPGQFILGAFTEAGELAGIVGFRRETSRKMRHKGMIWGMYVDPAAQGRGIGRGLMAELLRRAGELPGLELAQLAVVDANAPAKRLYESLGFAAYGLERNALKLDDGTYAHEVLMAYAFGG
ncbi:Ribosomal protein S18 acetylase RimI [Paenibacillus sp. UNC496MF]|uniref:GNAT family N-acetyltransferase n=1 Tax=Paenibacillus sp. UNC496MF TaxID=1502753 RepID=UPI0008E1A83E|nr:GNAT family N-acetyltransferase [Paenibacillus sp. UNC496MF]SFJ79322.1 Ribosomal protein S18 acetylase RimI [Paenibacillus sp. UNC496MF]